MSERIETSPAPTATRTVETVQVRAILLGERLDTRALERGELSEDGEAGGALATSPTAIAIPGGGTAVLFRYGVAVLFAPSQAAIDRFVAALAPRVTAAFPVPETDELRLVIRPDADQQRDLSGDIIWLRDKTVERLQLVADILAKSLVLAHYETRIAEIFDRVEPLAAGLRERGRAAARSRELLRQIGDVLLMQHRMVGRVETRETPELIWEHPELERLYMRLAEEYELHDRDRALDRKLEVISRTVETLLGLIQTRSSLRVEWYIVILIVAELALMLYPMVLHGVL